MERRQPIQTTVGQLHEAALGGDTMPLRGISDAMGATYTLLFAERVTDGGVQGSVVQGVDPAYSDRLRRAAAERMLPAWLRGLDPGTVMDRAALERDGEFARSAFFDYVVRPEGRFHCLITTPYVSPTQRFHMIVGRPFSGEDFSPEDVRVLRALLPHVGRLIATGEPVARVAEPEVLASALDQIQTNVVLVSQGCRVVFANKGARRLLGLRDGLFVDGDILTAADPQAQAALRQAVCRALRPGDAAEAGLSVPRPSGLAPFEVAATRLADAPDPLCQLSPKPPMAMLLIGQPDAQDAADGGNLARAFGLTCKERDLAMLLARGHDLRGAAEALGICYNTARYHLRHAFEKTGAHRQPDLIRLVLAGSGRRTG